MDNNRRSQSNREDWNLQTFTEPIWFPNSSRAQEITPNLGFEQVENNLCWLPNVLRQKNLRCVTESVGSGGQLFTEESQQEGKTKASSCTSKPFLIGEQNKRGETEGKREEEKKKVTQAHANKKIISFKRPSASSIYKGVMFIKYQQKWRAQFCHSVTNYTSTLSSRTCLTLFV